MPRKLVLIVAVVLAAGAVTAGIAIASGAGGDDKPLTGSSLQKASAAALAHTGGGTVVETEVGDDGAAYDVEVRLANGRVVEVEPRRELRRDRPGGRRRWRERRRRRRRRLNTQRGSQRGSASWQVNKRRGSVRFGAHRPNGDDHSHEKQGAKQASGFAETAVPSP